ncbi:acetylglutamate kinase [Tissierella sp. Yu-01]|uniref:acetylglutamate kinase n=1 Tax=Tissierella sp. Yu-01 TaxID=3035694 RepID=UPI00240D12FB|nr:acetylglutamate kinase [Tissierella sp. Yu-01]WFA08434.1 acetylglutamate kinase [Tissierella sp. Yu-01]
MKCISRTELEIINRLRLLWLQHSEWTRAAIIAIVLDLPNREVTVNRLLRNPRDFGMFFSIFYGERIGNEFSELLTEHLVLAAQLIEAILAGNTEEARLINERWYDNAREIARFLGRINPCWSEAEWRRMYFVHLEFVAEEATTLINGEYQRNVDVYDELELQALEMADMMSQGIIDQFIKKRCRP